MKQEGQRYGSDGLNCSDNFVASEQMMDEGFLL